jgi:6-phosphogluconate dehydrogenase
MPRSQQPVEGGLHADVTRNRPSIGTRVARWFGAVALPWVAGRRLSTKAVGPGSTARVNAETRPLPDPAAYRYRMSMVEITELRRRGRVIASWLLDLTAEAMVANPDLAGFGGVVADSAERRWTSTAAIDTGTPTPVLTTALYARFTSRGEEVFVNKVVSAMRLGFGGHVEQMKGEG